MTGRLGWRRAVAALLLLASAAALLGGCGSIRALGANDAESKEGSEVPETPKEAQAAPAPERAPSAAEAGPPAFEVRIDAPRPLARLLEANLDVVRLRGDPGGREIDPAEWARLIAAAPQQAKTLLETEGYFDAAVDARRESDELVRIAVTPGPRTIVRAVDIETKGALQAGLDAGDRTARKVRRQLVEKWLLPVGAPFRDTAWTSAKAGALAELHAAGYAAAALTESSARVEPERREAELAVTLDSGPLFLAGDVIVKGLVHHDESTVRNLAGFSRGTPLTEALLLDYQQRLIDANLFAGASVTAESDPARAGDATVTVTLTELELQQTTFGAGYSANTGARVTVDYTHRRPFGWAAILHDTIEYGQDLKSIDLELASHPREDFYRNLVGLQLQQLTSDTDEVNSEQLRLGRSQQTPRNERFYFVQLENSRRAVTVLSTEAAENVRAVSLNDQMLFRRLDNILLPEKGYSLSLQGNIGVAQSPQAKTGPFSRLYARAIGYRPLGSDWHLEARVEVGETFSADDVETPDSQRFRAGGEDSVRGYEYRTLAPTAGIVVSSGKVLFTSGVEFAHPILASLPALWGAVFVDAGRAANRWSDIDPAVGYGVGVRYRSPIGPLRLDVSYGEEVKAWRLDFSVGVTF